MTVAQHPTPEAIAAFARGDLPPDELAIVAEHIGGCAVCCAQIARIPEDTLAGLARDAGVAGLKALGPVRTVGAAAPTHNPPGSAKPTHDADGIPTALADHPRYKVLRELGAGGMGVVYKAEHRIMGRLVALKVMAPHLTAKAGAVERFRKEVRAAAQLNHPNIVTAHDADEAGGLHFLVMEYVEGTSLDRLVAKKGPLTVQLAASFTRQSALGLQNAHEKGMVHRDIKPQNMMVTRKAQVKVMDFGLARFVHTDEESDATRPSGRLPFGAARTVADPLTNPNLLMGTPDYLSPEQAKNSHNVDSRSDLYSLGCTLFFLLTGKPPFSHAPSLIDKLLAHTEDAPPSIRELRPDVPEGLAAVLEKLLAKKPGDRYETAADLAVALQPFLRGGNDAEARPGELDGIVAPASGVGLGAPGSGVGLRSQSAVVPGIGQGEGDTEPVRSERTVVENDRPRRSRRLKRAKARPWWDQSGVKLCAILALPVVVLLAILIAGRAKENPPPRSDPSPGSTKPIAAKPGKSLPFLFIVPSQGVNGEDYFPVKKRLIDAGLKVVTASGKGGISSPPEFDPNGKKVTVDLKVSEVDASEYSGIAFCGYNIDEYIDSRPGAPPSPLTAKIHRLLDLMTVQNRPLGGICIGEGVLAIHGVLDRKSVAKSPLMVKRFPDLMDIVPGAKWLDERVVAEGKIITARSAADGNEFADALLRALRAE